MAIDLTDALTVRQRMLILSGCGTGTAALILMERYLGPSIPLGPLFFLPLLVAAAYLPRWAIFLFSNLVAVLREVFGPFVWDANVPARLALSMVAFTGGALFAGELVRNRRFALALARKTQEEANTRSDAEKEIRALIEGSPAAVLTVDSEARIAMANAAARRLLGFEKRSPEGEPVGRYIPVLATLLKSPKAMGMVHTLIESNGQRRSGETFYSQIWVSSYASAGGPRLAAIIADATEQLRDREESGLRQLLSSSRIIAGAVSHEIRSLTSAAAILHHNLGNRPEVQSSADYEALGRVIDSIVQLSSDEVQTESEEVLQGVDVRELLEELRLIIAQEFAQVGAGLEWDIDETVPNVRANHSGLLQVLINLARNSCRALEGRPDGRLRITAYPMSESVVIRFADNGPGVPAAQPIFQPFHSGASSTGLGLFVSRAVVRTFGGELHHTQHGSECCFIVEMPAVPKSANA